MLLRQAREAAAAANTAAAMAAVTGAKAPTAATHASSSGGAAAAAAGSGGRGSLTASEHLALVRQRLVRQRLEFERLLGRGAAESAARGGSPLLEEDLRDMLDRHTSGVGAVGWAGRVGAGVGVVERPRCIRVVRLRESNIQHS